MKNSTVSNNRVRYFDYLRVLSLFAIVMIHVSADRLYSVEFFGANWQALNMYDSISRWGVPIFVMISGALFLEKEVSIKKIFTKYILRLIIAYLFWNVLHIAYAIFISGKTYGITAVITSIIAGRNAYHLWFIPMICVLYAGIPIFQQIVKNERIMKYYLLLLVLVWSVLPTLTKLLSDFGNYQMQELSKAIIDLEGDMYIEYLTGYPMYFILGYYLSKKDFKKSERQLVYILSALGFAMTVGLSAFMSYKLGETYVRYYNFWKFNILLESIGVFTFIKYNYPKSEKMFTIVSKLSKYSFGAYCVHVLILKLLKLYAGFTADSFNSFLAAPCLLVLIVFGSLFISMILNHIPILRKYIV